MSQASFSKFIRILAVQQRKVDMQSPSTQAMGSDPNAVAIFPDLSALRAEQNVAWSRGDYSKIGVTLQITGEELAEATNPLPGSKVLDVAAGNGNATLAFARRWCNVTSTDIVPSLLENGRGRAAAEGLDVEFQTADAENLPFRSGSFDIVTSTFGAMFATSQMRTATELMRVCRSGGRVALANWTPRSFVGALFQTMAQYLPSPDGVYPATQWGSESWLNDAFSPSAEVIKMNLKNFNFRYRSAEHFIDYFRCWYGPLHCAFNALDRENQLSLEQDIVTTIDLFNIATDGSMVVPSEYAEIIITKV